MLDFDTVNFEISKDNGYYSIETKNPKWSGYNEHFSSSKDLYFWMTQIATQINNHPVTPMGVSFTLAQLLLSVDS